MEMVVDDPNNLSLRRRNAKDINTQVLLSGLAHSPSYCVITETCSESEENLESFQLSFTYCLSRNWILFEWKLLGLRLCNFDWGKEKEDAFHQ